MKRVGFLEDFVELIFIKFGEKQQIIQEGELNDGSFQLVDELSFFSFG